MCARSLLYRRARSACCAPTPWASRGHLWERPLAAGLDLGAPPGQRSARPLRRAAACGSLGQALLPRAAGALSLLKLGFRKLGGSCKALWGSPIPALGPTADQLSPVALG